MMIEFTNFYTEEPCAINPRLVASILPNKSGATICFGDVEDADIIVTEPYAEVLATIRAANRDATWLIKQIEHMLCECTDDVALCWRCHTLDLWGSRTEAVQPTVGDPTTLAQAGIYGAIPKVDQR